jgi:hypothetical protein
MHFTPSEIAALVIAASFAAGLNVYATVLTLGVLARLHWAVLPGGLEMLGDWWVIGASAALFAAEFVADKIPGLDLVWNALHTFVRIPVAALLAYGATTHLSPQMQLLAVAVGSGIALAAHGSKTAVRAAITPSPEPVSNIALSTTEDVAAVGLSWLVTVHPWASATIALVAVVLAIFAVRWVVRAFRRMFGRTQGALAMSPRTKSA